MPVSDFAKFVESQQVGDPMEPDWAQVRQDWLDELDRFFVRVTKFLDEYVAAGTITHHLSDICLTEDDLGEYHAKKMVIQIGRKRVLFEPIGRLFIGCRGRIDAIGSVGRVQVLLVGSRIKSAKDLFRVTESVGGHPPASPTPTVDTVSVSWVWKIVTRTPTRQYVDLDKESFFALLMEVAGA